MTHSKTFEPRPKGSPCARTWRSNTRFISSVYFRRFVVPAHSAEPELERQEHRAYWGNCKLSCTESDEGLEAITETGGGLQAITKTAKVMDGKTRTKGKTARLFVTVKLANVHVRVLPSSASSSRLGDEKYIRSLFDFRSRSCEHSLAFSLARDSTKMLTKIRFCESCLLL